MRLGGGLGGDSRAAKEPRKKLLAEAAARGTTLPPAEAPIRYSTGAAVVQRGRCSIAAVWCRSQVQVQIRVLVQVQLHVSDSLSLQQRQFAWVWLVAVHGRYKNSSSSCVSVQAQCVAAGGALRASDVSWCNGGILVEYKLAACGVWGEVRACGYAEDIGCALVYCQVVHVISKQCRSLDVCWNTAFQKHMHQTLQQKVLRIQYRLTACIGAKTASASAR
jgi:hypothetical protein